MQQPTQQPITGYYQDEVSHWVARVLLNCKNCDAGTPAD
jgi:hypothetical protein